MVPYIIGNSLKLTVIGWVSRIGSLRNHSIGMELPFFEHCLIDRGMSMEGKRVWQGAMRV
jgi:hypothetical protein